MYVCNCNGLTQKQVKQAIEDQPRDVMSVYRYYDCRPQCGRCACEIRKMLNEAREAQAA